MSEKMSDNKTNNTVNIVVDMGKREIKAILFNLDGTIVKSINLNSCLIDADVNKRVNSFDAHNKYVVEIEESNLPGQIEAFEIGDSIPRGLFSRDNSKMTKHNKVCLISAIGLLLSEINASGVTKVNLIIGMPVSHMKRDVELQLFKDVIYKDKETGVIFSVLLKGSLSNNSTKYSTRFMLNSVRAFPEGLAFIPRFKLLSELSSSSDNIDNIQEIEEIVVIDIGGHNINLSIFNRDGYVEDSRSFDRVGINDLFIFLKNELGDFIVDTNRKLTDENIKEYVLNGRLPSNIKLVNDPDGEKQKEFIVKKVNSYIREKILETLARKEINLSSKGFIYLFTGGGSTLLKPYISKMFKDNLTCIKFSSTAKWDNCLSFMLTYITIVNKNLKQEEVFQTLSAESHKKLSNLDKDFPNIRKVDVNKSKTPQPNKPNISQQEEEVAANEEPFLF